MTLNKKISIFLLGLFISCSGSSKSSFPSWVNDAKSTCSSNSICAVGSGQTEEEAKEDARTNIQKYFETKINSNFVSKLTVNNDKSDNYTSERLNSRATGILKGVDFRKIHRQNGVVYVLASLEKKTINNELKFNMDTLDEKMKNLMKDGNMSSIKKAEKLYNERAKLNEKYLFVNGVNYPEVVSYSTIHNEKNESKKKNVSYFLTVSEKGLKNVLSQVLTDNGGVIVSNGDKAYYTVSATVKSKKLYLKLTGFEKYSITFNVNIIKNGIIINSINKVFVESGVNYEQIYLSVLNEFDKFLDDNLMDYILLKK